MAASAADRPALPTWLAISAGSCIVAALYLIFLWVPADSTMGAVQRVFYFHVPAAVVSFLAAFVGGIASILYLWTRQAGYDDLSVAANESVVVFSAVNIVMGALWAKPLWGVWWTWDAKLTSSLILLIIYWSYTVVRRATPVQQRAGVCAVISIFGMLDVPFVYLANRLFRTNHPAPDEYPAMDPRMLTTLLASMVAMLLLWWCVVRVRRRLASLERVIEGLSLELYDVLDRGAI
jgi:heme exporter protein C